MSAVFFTFVSYRTAGIYIFGALTYVLISDSDGMTALNIAKSEGKAFV